MKVRQQFARAFWDLQYSSTDHPNSTCKRLRPLAPKLFPSDSDTGAIIDLKSFIRPDGGPRKQDPPPHTTPDQKKDQYSNSYRGPETTLSAQVGGTRWNPTQEQIGILERMYRGGMRTPNAQQIEQITAQLSKYGKIEGKNVFYWFQNHKARERQKQKRTSLLSLSPSPSSPASITLSFDTNTNSKEDLGREEQASGKRKCRTWILECLLPEENATAHTANDHHHHHHDQNTKCTNANFNGERDEEEEMGHKKTLELFPLHPEGISMMGVPAI